MPQRRLPAEWEPQAGVQLTSRSGALSEIEYSEFVQKAQQDLQVLDLVFLHVGFPGPPARRIRRLVEEVPCSGEDHRDAPRVGELDARLVVPAATRLDGRRGARVERHFEGVVEGQEPAAE